MVPPHPRDLSAKLWRLCTQTDARLAPIARGENEWEPNDRRIILEIAQRDGVIIGP